MLASASRRLLAALWLIGLGALLLTLDTRPASAMKIQTVKSPAGIEAWLVEEHSLPLVTLQFGFLGGASQDPAERPGVAHFLTAMLDEGAGEMRAAQFQERLEDLAVKLSFDSSKDMFTGSFQSLTENLAEAAPLVRLALTSPRFDQDAVDRMRGQILAGIQFDAQDPEKVASDAWFRLAFEGHPYAQPLNGTSPSVTAIGPNDLEAYRSRVFARDTLKVAVVGDIDATRLASLLDELFGGLPAKAELQPVPALPPLAGPRQQVIDMDVPQSVVQFGQSAMARKDPDFMAATVLNYIIGGGGFSSRLMEEVREKRGLAYGVYTYLQPYKHASIYLGGVATKNEAVATSLEVIRSELARMASEGPTEQELEDAKRYLTGSYALRFDTSGKIAGQLLGIQLEDLGIDYVDIRNDQVEAVTIEQIRRVAKSLLKPDGLIVTIVGKPQNLN